MSVIVVNKIQRMLFEIIISKIRCTKSQQKKKYINSKLQSPTRCVPTMLSMHSNINCIYSSRTYKMFIKCVLKCQSATSQLLLAENTEDPES